MEEELNIANILKDKPSGTKLYADAFGELSFERVNLSSDNSIYVKTKSFNRCSFYSDGKYTKDGEPVLVPSKKMHDWNKFAWKKGDILVSNDGKTNVIFNKWEDDSYASFYGRHYLNNENKDKALYYKTFVCTTEMYSIANKDIAKSYINAVEEKLGGKLNLKTLEIEKTQLEFKDGDIVVTDAVSSMYYSKCIFILKEDLSTNEKRANSYVFYNVENNYVDFNIVDTRIRDRNIRLATDSEKQQLFNTLAKKNKAWNAEKKVVEDIKIEYQFKPFEKVLVRDTCDDIWKATFFSHIKDDDNSIYKYVCNCISWRQCIPYEGNESLLGTTKDVED